MAVRAAELARQRAAVANLSKEEYEVEDDDDTPPFARSFRKEGRLFVRPQKPRFEIIFSYFIYDYTVLIKLTKLMGI